MPTHPSERCNPTGGGLVNFGLWAVFSNSASVLEGLASNRSARGGQTPPSEQNKAGSLAHCIMHNQNIAVVASYFDKDLFVGIFFKFTW